VVRVHGEPPLAGVCEELTAQLGGAPGRHVDHLGVFSVRWSPRHRVL